jgi:hypothetical protein
MPAVLRRLRLAHQFHGAAIAVVTNPLLALVVGVLRGDPD